MSIYVGKEHALSAYRAQVVLWLRDNPGWHTSGEIRDVSYGWQPEQLTRILLNTKGIKTKMTESGERHLWAYEDYDG